MLITKTILEDRIRNCTSKMCFMLRKHISMHAITITIYYSKYNTNSNISAVSSPNLFHTFNKDPSTKYINKIYFKINHRQHTISNIYRINT
jgi:hypothetical protein